MSDEKYFGTEGAITGMTVEEIARNTDISVGRVAKGLLELLERGLVDPMGGTREAAIVFLRGVLTNEGARHGRQ